MPAPDQSTPHADPLPRTEADILAGLIEAEADEAAGRYADAGALVARLRHMAASPAVATEQNHG